VTTRHRGARGQFRTFWTIGTSRWPIGARGWLLPLDRLGANYYLDDLLPAIRAGLSHGASSSRPVLWNRRMTLYRRLSFRIAPA